MMDAIEGYLGLPEYGLPGMIAQSGHHGEPAHAEEHAAPFATGSLGAEAGAPTGSPAPRSVATQEV